MPGSASGSSEADPVADFYRHYYRRVFNAEGFVGWSYRKTHRAVERRHPGSPSAEILEIGAGTGEHLPFVADDFARYVMVDLSPEPADPAWARDPRVTWVQGDVCDDIFPAASFNRVISMCVLHHLADPSAALSNVRSWLKPGGVFTCFLPSDPGLLNRVNRRLFVTPRARRMGFGQYELVNAREHRNHYWALREELLHTFRGCRISRSYWPTGLPLADLSLFSIWNIAVPRDAAAS